MNYSAYDLNGELGAASIDLSKSLGRGATAEVHIASLNGKTYAAKIYHTDTRVNSAKIRAMLANPPESMYLHVENASFAQFTWPIAMLRDSIGYDVGFLMPIVDLSESFPLDYYYDQTLIKKLNSRSEGALSYKLEIARNVCILVSDLHSRGHNFIDLKPQNIRVQRSSHVVSFLDCDGFSISGSDNQRYPAELVSTDYISPEAFKQNTSPRNLGEDQDLYALAVILFQLLTRGTHPFQGIIRDQSINANTNDEKASLGLYPHGMKPDTRISPRPQSTHFLLDDALWALFDSAFIGGAGKRPKAVRWVECFNKLLANHAVTRCEKEPNDVLHMRFAGKQCSTCYLSNLTPTKSLPTKVSAKKPDILNSRSPVTNTPNSTIPSFTPPLNPSKPSNSGTFILLAIGVIFIGIVVNYNNTRPPQALKVESTTSPSQPVITSPEIAQPKIAQPQVQQNPNTCMYSVKDESSNELCMVYLRRNETSCNKLIENEFRSRGLSLKSTNCGEPLTEGAVEQKASKAPQSTNSTDSEDADSVLKTPYKSKLLVDGYVTGNKIHMVGGSNGNKPYVGFILNKNTRLEDELVLSGDYLRAFKVLRKIEISGDRTASHNIGLMYIRGMGVQKDVQVGMEFLKKSMEELSNYNTSNIYYQKAIKDSTAQQQNTGAKLKENKLNGNSDVKEFNTNKVY